MLSKNLKNHLFYLYFLELLFRSLYVFISLLLCVSISFFDVNALLLLETYPYLKFSNKEFLIVHTTDLLNVVWTLSFTNAFLIVFPFYLYQLFLFFKSGWYVYQIRFIRVSSVVPVLVYVISLVICYTCIVPMFLDFLSQWEVRYFKNVLNVSFSLHIFSYINWILAIKYCICFYMYTVVLFFVKVYYLVNFNKLYKLMKLYKKQALFASLLMFFVLSPPDVFLQLFLIFCSFLLVEILHFVFCYIVVNFLKY